MTIVLVRIDDRLVHGQILEGWVPSTKAQQLVVANDAAACDDVLKMIMEAATPEAIGLVVETVDRVAEILLQEPESRVRKMIIVDDPRDALRLKRAGVPFDRLNLGNLRAADGEVHFSRSVILGEQSLGVLHEIVGEGVQIYIQSVPFEAPIKFPKAGA